MTSPDRLDDFNNWPQDPYELFGLRPGSDLRTIRRAYTHLIRRFKPEHSPNEFRRIREAYEFLQLAASWENNDSGENREQDTEASPSLKGDASSGNPGGEPFRQEVGSTPSSSSDSPELSETECWEKVRSGSTQSAYDSLVALHMRRPHQGDVCSRLYWLLKLDSTLDNQRQPVDWLIAALSSNGLLGKCLELYRLELTRNPSEIDQPRSSKLLEAPAPAERQFELATYRWSAAARCDRWDVIESDLKRIRDPMLAADPVLWLRIVLAAIDRLAWELSGPALSLCEWCRSEVDRLGDFHLMIPEAIDRMHLLLDIAWSPFFCERNSGQQMRELIARSWNGALDTCRPIATDLAAQWSCRPRNALEDLDDCQNWSPAGLQHLANCFAWLSQRDRLSKGSRQAPPHAFEGLQSRLSADYAWTREHLARSCFRERIALFEVEEFLDSLEEELSDDLHHEFMNDVPLHCLMNAGAYLLRF